MAMLLRTRKNKVALALRVVCVLTVTFIYLINGLLQKDDGSHAHHYGETQFGGRHLLAITEPNDTIIIHQRNGTTKTSNVTHLPLTNCTPPAINEFPSDGFTRAQRQQGWVVIHALIACYLFILLAIVCDDYFVPAIKNFCDALNMSEDIAGATFMATASSSPELFINCVGTFVTQGDLGVGTIVGSAVFNILAVPACCGLFGNMVLDLEWWPISRDSFMYGLSVILLIVFLRDGKIFFNEALTLVVVYIGYILLMYFNKSLRKGAHSLVAKFRRPKYYKEIIDEKHPLLFKDKNGNAKGFETDILETELTLQDCEDLEESTKIWEWPSEESTSSQIWWVLTWPISFILYTVTPDCRKHPRLSAFTFIICIFWIGGTSYMVAWLITVVGDTLDIPDSVMGLTFLAAGTSVPEAVSSVIVTNQGFGSMGISSSIGSNTFDILLCLGLPWLIKTAFYPKVPGQHWIKINSSGLNYSALSLLSTLVLLYLSIALNKFKLDWKVGLICLLTYIGFLTLASLIELNVFFPVNLPTCDH
ncbi:sodium/potassium/calcium exchanger 4-like [Aethina tumida]|uniref:sodium/potassium/calcium exchanger 4-like n=1 Tax=Aethina tumida TaxID=116153 RepID=UPI00096B4ED1|nr:sodium/potassium/calcium exchanger 4-like [Aethina tumida]